MCRNIYVFFQFGNLNYIVMNSICNKMIFISRVLFYNSNLHFYKLAIIIQIKKKNWNGYTPNFMNNSGTYVNSAYIN